MKTFQRRFKLLEKKLKLELRGWKDNIKEACSIKEKLFTWLLLKENPYLENLKGFNNLVSHCPTLPLQSQTEEDNRQFTT